MKKFTYLPDTIRAPLVSARNQYKHFVRKRALSRLSSRPIKKLVVGAGGTHFLGWVSAEREELNLLEESDWTQYFKENTLDCILAEHVWEHLDPKDALLAAKNCFKFLKPGAYLRVAVPDGCHPDKNYIDEVKPGGSGSGADDHKVLYTYETFRELFLSAGFDVSLLEYFDEKGKFYYKEWSESDGFIERSKRFDSRNEGGKLRYTSIALDAIKPDISKG